MNQLPAKVGHDMGNVMFPWNAEASRYHFGPIEIVV